MAEKLNKKKLNPGEFPTDWSIESYRTEHESAEHWELRKNFMQAHKDKYPEDELVCLAQVFTNMEFLGCRYPPDTMRLIAELSEDIAKDFRAKRALKLKRTFVSASDAAEARAKGLGRTAMTSQNSNSDSRPRFGIGEQNSFDKLFENCLCGKFILALTNDRFCIKISAQRANMGYVEKESVAENDIKVVEIFLNNILLACSTSNSLKEAKCEAFKNALEFLQRNCYTIQLNPTRDFIKIEKSKDKVICDISKNKTENVELDENCIGFKIMKSMGWEGGGLGANRQGRQNPVDYLFRNNRSGFGNEAAAFDRKYFSNLLQNYVQSEDIRELRFEPTFSKDERVILHEITKNLNLKSHSHGKGENRALIVSKKLSVEQILREILIDRNVMFQSQYRVQVPESKGHEFPEYTAKLVQV